MKLGAALILALLTTPSLAAGVAYMDEPLRDGMRVRVLLSDMAIEPERCDGMTEGRLGKVSLRTYRGEELQEVVGCWAMMPKNNDIAFVATVDGKTKYWWFPIDKFDRVSSSK